LNKLSELLSEQISPEAIADAIKTMDMTWHVRQLFDALPVHGNTSDDNVRRAALLGIVNVATHHLTLHCTEYGNLSVQIPQGSTASSLYSVPGCTLLFAMNDQSFTVDLYNVFDDHLALKERAVVREGQPLLIEGPHTLFDCHPCTQDHCAIVGSLNWPDRTADISVFDRESLRKIAWFPHDESAARFLVSLELLEATQDPGLGKIAEELIYHYHPAVAWKAFQVIHHLSPQAATHYVPLLRQLDNPHLDGLLDQWSQAA